jgi:hypothetical protein
MLKNIRIYNYLTNSLLQNTKNVSNLSDSFLVKIFVILNNPQITKARRIFFKSEISNFFGLSMLVGISEAIRLLSTYFVFLVSRPPAQVGKGGGRSCHPLLPSKKESVNLIKKSVS